jgi:hypothetical protein
MTLSDLVLWASLGNVAIIGLAFAFFGLQGFLTPDVAAKKLNLAILDPAARTAIRCLYGGFQLGFGAYLIVAGIVLHAVVAALVAIICIQVTLTAARGYGLAYDGGNPGVQKTYLLMEAAALISSTALLAAHLATR